MYRNTDYSQMTIYDFIHPFGGHLDEENRWVKLHDLIDWDMIDEEYSTNFDNESGGQEAYPAQLAFGSLYIQRRLGYTDRELVEQIRENPYMQYFVGFKEYKNKKPFDASLLVTFRKRFPEETMNRIIEKMFIEHADVTIEKTLKKNDDAGPNETMPAGDDGASSCSSETNIMDDKTNGQDDSLDESVADSSAEPAVRRNEGTLVIDASCVPADIAYPTDLELCDKARKWTEVILDHYWVLYGSVNGKREKPRTYRGIARQRFLRLNKRKKKSAKKIRKELRFQLNCIARNLEYIESYSLMYGFRELFRVERERLFTIYTFHEQQREMLESKTHSVPERIVSLSQPWIRPIVRGKSKSPVEFGAKISISVVNGYTFIDRLCFDAYNEGEASEFKRVVEEYRRRFGHYPKRILADKIYRSRQNRDYCKEHNIHLAGPKLGRPGKTRAEDLRQELKEVGERNEVEGKFGTGKRKLGLSLITAKLQETAGSMIAMDIFIMNLERLLRQKVLFLYTFFKIVPIGSFNQSQKLENMFACA